MNYCKLVILLTTVSLAPSCSEQELLEPQDSATTPVAEECEELTLLDLDNRQLQSVPEQFGTYRLIIDEPGEWQLHSTSDFVQMEREFGCGHDTLWVMVGRNWWHEREAQIILTTCGALPDGTTGNASNRRFTLNQQANQSLSSVANKINSSMGAGYSYCPADLYTLGTGIQIFNMHQFAGFESDYDINLMTDDYYPTIDNSVCTSTSLSSMQSQLNISVSADLDLKLFVVHFTGGYTSSDVSKGSRTYAAKRLNSTLFSREVNYLNAIAFANEHPELRDRVFAPGFLLLHDQLVYEINATSSRQARKELCRSFVKAVGPCFISKAQMGCNMDFWISTDTHSLEQTMNVEALLQFKWESWLSVDVDATGTYTTEQQSLCNETQAHFNLRGGDARMISLFNSGEGLSYPELQQWLLNVEPGNAVLVDMHLEPIYLLFTDPATREALGDYIKSLTNV